MKRKTKIIILISCICIISLILLGLTYAYYNIKLTSNSSEKSIVVKSGKSIVKYTDLSTDNISETITPGYTVTKVFTVQNIGTISGTYSIFFTNVVNELTRTQDIKYTLYRKSGNNTIDTSDYSDCTKVVENATFPTSNSVIASNEVITTPNDYYTYALVVTYINQDENQSADQGKRFDFKVKISATSDNFSDTFANVIITNAYSASASDEANGIAVYRATPSTTVGNVNNATEASLSVTTDDLGTSYYFRGNVKNNYVNFAGMCWRVVRIEGDNSIKIILEDYSNECASTTGNFNDYTGLFSNYLSTKISSNYSNKTISDYLKEDEWCLENVEDNTDIVYYIKDPDDDYPAYYYNGYKRIDIDKSPSLVCDGVQSNSYYGLLTADEVSFAGDSSTMYLITQYMKDEEYHHFLTSTFSTSSPNDRNYYSYIVTTEGLDTYDLGYSRYAVTLKSSITVTGSGTKTDPYIVS